MAADKRPPALNDIIEMAHDYLNQFEGEGYYNAAGALLSRLIDEFKFVTPWGHAAIVGINPNTLVGSTRRGIVPGSVSLGARGWLVQPGAVELVREQGKLGMGRGKYTRKPGTKHKRRNRNV